MAVEVEAVERGRRCQAPGDAAAPPQLAGLALDAQLAGGVKPCLLPPSEGSLPSVHSRLCCGRRRRPLKVALTPVRARTTSSSSAPRRISRRASRRSGMMPRRGSRKLVSRAAPRCGSGARREGRWGAAPGLSSPAFSRCSTLTPRRPKRRWTPACSRQAAAVVGDRPQATGDAEERGLEGGTGISMATVGQLQARDPGGDGQLSTEPRSRSRPSRKAPGFSSRLLELLASGSRACACPVGRARNGSGSRRGLAGRRR